MWDDLSMTEKAQLMKEAVSNGITDHTSIMKFVNNYSNKKSPEPKQTVQRPEQQPLNLESITSIGEDKIRRGLRLGELISRSSLQDRVSSNANIPSQGEYPESSRYDNGGVIERTDVEDNLREFYPTSFDQYPARVAQDSNYNPPGYGNIETFLPRPDNPEYDRILYNTPDGTFYRYDNPFPGDDTIVANDRVRDLNQAAQLDYLHVLRARDPQYQVLLKNLQDRYKGTNIEEEAKFWYNKDLENAKNKSVLDPYESYVNNATDGWLRSSFHTGTPQERLADRYPEDLDRMLRENPTLFEPTREIYNYLHPYELDEVEVVGKKIR